MHPYKLHLIGQTIDSVLKLLGELLLGIHEIHAVSHLKDMAND